MGRRALPIFAAAAAALALALIGCGGGGSDPYRVGVVVDCVGLNRSLHDAELAGAELPLLERGAQLRGHRAEEGVSAVEVGGREVEIVPGCTELWEFSTLTAEVRKLVERDQVDAVIAAGSGPDEVVLAEVARLYPQVAFIAVAHGPREVTLRRRPPNLFRFAGDHGQGVAGLGTYAYRDLGWRTAAIVLFNWDHGWGARDAFAAEFCALGGRVVDDLALEEFDPAGADVAKLPPDVDGVAVFVPAFANPAGFLNRLAERYRPPAQRILLGPATVDEPALLRTTRRALGGVVGSSFERPARLRAYLRSFHDAFPGIPADVAGGELVTGYSDATRALLAGLEAADGDSARVAAALGRLRVDLLGGPVRGSAGGQAEVPVSLVRIEPSGGAPPGLAEVETIGPVDQSVGGLLASSAVPYEVPARCAPGAKPPPWAG